MATATANTIEFKDTVRNVIEEFFQLNREQFKSLEALFIDGRDTFAIYIANWIRKATFS